jgi:crotonobetainyl-CoA:carnitine CoA-transferase CaiB-like acyl-CoA transferase
MALTGAAFRQASYADQPVYLIAPVLHYAQGTMAAGAAGAALLERSRSGLGQAVTVSGLHAVALVGGASGLIMPRSRSPLGASPSYRLYECGDGEFLFLATLFSYFFQRATQAMGLGDIALVSGGFPQTVAEIMEARFREKPRDEWLAILRAADVPTGPVCRREDWLASELIANNDMRAELMHPELGPITMPGVPVKLARTPGRIRGLIRDVDDAEVEALFPSPLRGGVRGGGAGSVSAAEPPERTVGKHHANTPTPDPSPQGGGETGLGEDASARERSKAPLAGVRVLDLGTVIAGAYASAILANLGAEVVKVESAEGDPWRDYGIGFVNYNRGKRGLVVDLKQPAGRELFLDLARQADVVLDNYRVGVRERLGIGHDAVTAVNPRLISCSVTTYGARGEETRRPGFDPLLQARSGMMAAQGGDGDEPVFHIIAVNDFATASMAAFGVIAALNARERTGEGQVAETSLTAQSAMFQSGELTTWPGAPPAAKGCRDCLGVSALDRFYRCADGWILVACADAAEAAALAEALGRPEWTAAFDMLAEPRDGDLAAELGAVLGKTGVAEALTALVRAGVRAMPVREGEEIFGDRWLWENDFFEAVHETPHGSVAERPFAAFSRSPAGYDRPEPGLGEHSFEVLADWGIDAERIQRLADDGVVMRLC